MENVPCRSVIGVACGRGGGWFTGAATACASAVDLAKPRDIEDQRHPAVAENGRATDAIDRVVVGLEAFHDDLLLTQELIDHDADRAGACRSRTMTTMPWQGSVTASAIEKRRCR